jgi:hypothetical protein
MAFHSWDNWEVCPDIGVAVDQTVVGRLLPLFLECELDGFLGDVENNRTTRSSV